jgi:tetratricopeptide (TPR) repeat protein
LEEVLLKGDWQTVRRETKADSPNLIDRFLFPISCDFTGQIKDERSLTELGNDTTAARIVINWSGQFYSENLENPSALYVGGAVAMLGGEYDMAVNILSDVIRNDPGCQPAYTMRGTAHIGLGNSKFALADFAIALQLDSNDVAALSNRATIKMSVREYRSALEDLDRALRIEPQSSELLFNRGNANIAIGLFSDCGFYTCVGD